MKTIKLTLAPILIGVTLLGSVSKVYGDTKPHVKTDANITFIDGTTTAGSPASNHLLPLGEQTIPKLICAGLILLVLVALICYIRKKGTLKYEKNKLFTLFSLTLLSMGTPLTSIAQVVAVSQDKTATTTALNDDTENKQEQETKPETKDEAESVTTVQEKTDEKKSDKKETETKATEEPKNEKITPSDKKARASNPGNLKNNETTWGNASWSFDSNTGSLIINSGTLGQVGSAPWNLTDSRKIDANKIKKISFTGATKTPVNADYLFQKLSNLREFENLPNLDTSETTAMVDMFRDCTSLTTLDLSQFNTKKLTDMRGTFRGCTSIKSLDLSSLNTLSVTAMDKLFENVPLVSLTLGDNFKFIPVDVSLSKPKSLLSTSELQREGKYLTGKWIKKDNQSAAYDTKKFMENYGKGDLTAGSYVADTSSLTWGDAPWAFDADTGILTINSGTLDKPENAPWKLTDNRKIDAKKIKKINFTGAIKAPENAKELFKSLTELTEFENLTNLDTSDVTNMDDMFYDCYKLKKLDLSNFNTTKVTSIAYMFFYCKSLTALDLSKFDTKNVNKMAGLFKGCKLLKTLDLSGFNTLNKPTMTDMFNDTVLSSLTLGDEFRFIGENSANLPKPAELKPGVTLTGNWIKVNRGSYPQSPAGFMEKYGTKDLTAGTYVAEIKSDRLWGDAPWTFDTNTGTLTIESGRLAKSDESPWNKEGVEKIDKQLIKKIIFTGPVLAPEDATELFYNLTNLTEFENLTYLNTSEVTKMDKMFYDCYALKKLDLSNFNTAKVTSINHMFLYCKSLTALDLSKFDTKKMTDMSGLFKSCKKLKTLDLSSFNTLNKPTMTDMFKETVLSSLTLGDEFRFVGDDSSLPNPAVLTPGDLKREGKYLTGKWIKKDNQSAAYAPDKFMTNYGEGDLKAGTYVAEIKSLLWGDAPYTFDSDTGTLTINSGTLDKTVNAPWKLTDNRKIDAEKIKKISFTGATKAPVNAEELFKALSNLTEIEGLASLDTSDVTSMLNMFRDCSSLVTLDLSNFNTEKVTDIRDMFRNCTSLTTLDLSKFNTKKVIDMRGMFRGCTSIKSLDLSTFDTSGVTTLDKLFENVPLMSLTLGDNFKFVNTDSDLSKPQSLSSTSELQREGKYLTGKWIKKDNQSAAYSVGDFMTNYGKGDLKAGTYIADTSSLTWGDAPWDFDSDTGILTINSGTLDKPENAPWKLTDNRKIDAEKIKKINFTGATKAPVNAKALFKDLNNLAEIAGLTNLDTSDVTNMDEMFYNCYALTHLDLSNFDTVKVTTIVDMFLSCTSLKTLDLSKFNTKNIKKMAGLFKGCKLLKTLDLSGFNTANVTTMTDMFNDTVLSSLTLGDEFRFVGDNINLPKPAELTPGVTLTGKWIKVNRGSYAHSPQGFMREYGKNGMNAGTYVAEIKSDRLWGDAPWTFDTNTGTLTIESGRLAKSGDSPWNRSDDKKIDGKKIKKIIFTGPVLAPEDATELFYNLTSLTKFENLTYLNTSEVTRMDKMFYDCYALKKLDLSNFNTAKVTSMVKMFFYCVTLESLDLSKFDTKNVTDMSGLFFNCKKLKTLDISGFNTITTSPRPLMKDMFTGTILSSLTLGNDFWFSNADANLPVPSSLNAGDQLTGKWIKKNRDSFAYSPKDFMTGYTYLIDGMAGTYVAEIKAPLVWGDLPWRFDENTGTLTIEKNGRLAKSEESPWNRQDDKAIDKQLIKKIVFKGKAKAPENAKNLFKSLSNLTDIAGLTYLDTSGSRDMSGMFQDCSALKEIDLSNFTINSLTTIANMFSGCASLETLDLSKFRSSATTDMTDLFKGCVSLKSVDISRLVTDNVTNMTGMFQDCATLSSIDFSKFNTDRVSNMTRMFQGCASLTNLDLSTFSTSKTTNNTVTMTDMFKDAQITSITLGTYFRFKGTDSHLKPFDADAKSKGRYLTGNWMDKSTKKIYLPEHLYEAYGQEGLRSGTFIPETLPLRWGDVPWGFDDKTGTLTFSTGTLDELSDTSPWERQDGQDINGDDVKKIVFTGDVKAPQNSAYLFNPLKNLTEIVGLDKLDTSKATTMEGMFAEALSLTALDLSKFNTKKVTNMKNMFTNVPLTSISLGNNVKFSGTDCGLFIPPALPDGTPLTGKWIEKDGHSRPYLNKAFVEKYDYGNGEIKAGTYITEVYIGMSVLETNLSFSTDSGKTVATTAAIGDQLQGKLTVKHAAGSAEDSTSIAVKLSNISLLTDAWTLSPTVTVTTFDQTGKQTASKEQTIKDDALSLPVLPYGSYFEITLKGTAWEKAYAIPSGNYNYTLSYKNQAGDQKVDKTDNFVINSGKFGFKSVPNISFKDSVLPLASNQIIDRKDPDYEISVTDYRGTRLPDGETAKSDRVNWEITATASPFKDAAGKEIKLSTMAVSFTKAIGQTTELGADAILIASHDVTGETAKQHNLTKLSWAKEIGFKAVVHNRSGLDTTKYTANVDFDLRTAP